MHAQRIQISSAMLLRAQAALALLLGLALTGCRPHDFPVYPAKYREYAYVSNGGSNTVTVLDVVNLRVDRTVRVGANPTGVAVNPRRNEVYVVNSGSGTVSVIDAEKNSVAARAGDKGFLRLRKNRNIRCTRAAAKDAAYPQRVRIHAGAVRKRLWNRL